MSESAKMPVILVVDDTTSLVSPWKAEVAKFYKMINVVGWFEALSRLREYPDMGLVIVNLSLARVNGVEAVTKIREKNRTLCMIVIAKPEDQKKVQTAMQSGITDFLLMPFKAEDLLAKMAKHCTPAEVKAEPEEPAADSASSAPDDLTGIKEKYYQAQSSFANGQMDDAIKVYNEIVNEKKLKDAHLKYAEESWFQMGRCWLRKNDYNKAIEVFKQFFNKAPKSQLTRQALFYVGQAYEALKDPAKALNFYAKVISLGSTDSLANQARKQVNKIQGND